MGTLARAFVIFGSLAIAIGYSAAGSARSEQPVLLNCRLMERADPLYERFCNGEKDRYVSCSETICILVNFRSQYSSPQVTLAGDGSDNSNDLDGGVDKVAGTAPPAGGTPPDQPPGGTDQPGGLPQVDPREQPQSAER
jgi:hypothetical protein